MKVAGSGLALLTGLTAYATQSPAHLMLAASTTPGKPQSKSVAPGGVTEPGASANSKEVLPVVGAESEPGTSTLSLKAELQKARKSKLSADFYLESDAHVREIKDRRPSAVVFQYFAGPRYSLGQTTSVYIWPQWSTVYNSASGPLEDKTRAANGVTHMGDTIIGISDSKLARWGNGGSLLGIGRFYIPTGELSRSIGQRGLLFSRMIATQPLNKRLNLIFQAITEYWLQSRNSSINSTGKLVGNPNFEIVPFFSLSAKVFEHLNFTQSLGMDYTWVRGDAAVNLARKITTQTYIDTSVSTDVIPHLTVFLGANNDGATLNNGSGGFRAYRDSETYYYMMLLASI